jgi:hypothetical protein
VPAVGRTPEDVLTKEQLVRIYSVDRAGGILKGDFKFHDPDGDNNFEDRVLAFAERIETYINNGGDVNKLMEEAET